VSETFFQSPVLNSPYEYPSRHWELDATGQPTNGILDSRRPADFITPIPKPKKQRGDIQSDLVFNEARACRGRTSSTTRSP
jgi:type III restriction enzyme